MSKKLCDLCESYSYHYVTFYGKCVCEDCIHDIKAFEVDFERYKEIVWNQSLKRKRLLSLICHLRWFN